MTSNQETRYAIYNTWSVFQILSSIIHGLPIGRLAQSVERGANNAKVVGSRPTLAILFT